MSPLGGLTPPLTGVGRCLVMGVLNVTPDSFSDGGRYDRVEDAVRHGRGLFEAGADLIDVGGESTRPGAERTPAEEERRRVLPVVAALTEAGVPVSVDTMRADTARAAVQAGAVLVNDVSGGLADPAMLDTVAGLGVPCVLMHWRGPSAHMQEQTWYDDVVAEVCAALEGRLEAAQRAGIAAERVVLDPGIGFAKTATQNWQVLAGLPRLVALGRPILVAVSRKRFLGELLADAHGPREPEGRDAATAAASTLAAAHGAWAVRVHEVRASADAVRVVARWHTAEQEQR